MSTGDRFRAFLSNIQLSENQIKDAITKHTGVRRTLHNAYYTTAFVKAVAEELEEAERLIRSYKSLEILLDETSRYRTSLLVGSYGKNTAIAPPSDIDILFEMPSHLFAKYDEVSYNGQSQLLQDVKAVLKKTYPNTDIRGDGQIVDVPFVTYKVEVLPAFKRTTGAYFYPDTHGGGSWKTTDPRAEKKHLRESNKRSAGNTIKLIKMMKAWKRYCNVPIKSLALELEAVRFLTSWEYYDKSEVYFDWLTRDFFRHLLSCVNGGSVIPGITEFCPYGSAWQSKVESALARSIKACEYESAEEETLATLEWKKIYGDRFYF
jgi:hypothetical protein